jgi:predicted PurR-regulated permease PerM
MEDEHHAADDGTEPVPPPDVHESPAPTAILISTQTIWQSIGAILLTLLAFWAITQARTLVSMLIISFFFSLAMQPAVNRLRSRYGWRRGLAVGAIYLAGFAFLIFLIWVLIPAISQLAQAIGESGGQWLQSLDDRFSDIFGVEIIDPETSAEISATIEENLAGWVASVFGTVLGFATSTLGFIFNMATVAMFTFYFTADAPRIQKAVLSLFRPKLQQKIGWTWDEAVTQTGGYFYSRSILMFINGLGFFFTMVLVGVPTALAIPLALFGAFVSVFIPAVGTYIGGAIPIFVTLAIQGLVAGLIVLGYVLIYQQIENYWLSPKISANTMSLNGGVAFGAALAGGALAGPMGAFMALPVAALITSFISNYAAHHEVVYQSPFADEEPSITPDEPDGSQAGTE